MAASIEGRYPYLDHTLIEFANTLPPSWKIRGLTEKHILRRALATPVSGTGQALLPSGIAQRTKQPYRAPDSASFFVDGKPLDYVADLFSAANLRASGPFDVEATTRLFAQARAGRVGALADNTPHAGVLSTRPRLRTRGGGGEEAPA